MSIWLLVFLLTLFFVGLVAIWRSVHRHIAYYLPPVSIAKLALEVKQNAATSSALVDVLHAECEKLKDLTLEIEQLQNVSAAAHDKMLTVVLDSTKSLVNQYGPEVFDSIIRNASNRLANHLEMGLLDRTTKVAGEYVLLQSLDDLELEVSLDARYARPEDIRTAVVNLIKWNPPKGKRPPKSDNEVASYFMDLAKEQRNLDNFMGEVGEELFRMKWEGKLAMKVQKKEQVPNTPTSIVMATAHSA